MKRYFYRGTPQRPPGAPTPKWVIPALLIGVVASVLTYASISIAGADDASRGATRAALSVPVMPDDAPPPAEAPLSSAGLKLASAPPDAGAFDHCSAVRQTCVVDGDTFWLDGVKIRIMDIDTPEVSQPQCPYEKELGDQATQRLIELLNAGPFELRSLGGRDEDQYGRKLRVVVRDSRSLGDQLVAEGLARTWSGRRDPWC